jgi:hypothetical protein
MTAEMRRVLKVVIDRMTRERIAREDAARGGRGPYRLNRRSSVRRKR